MKKHTTDAFNPVLQREEGAEHAIWSTGAQTGQNHEIPSLKCTNQRGHHSDDEYIMLQS